LGKRSKNSQEGKETKELKSCPVCGGPSEVVFESATSYTCVCLKCRARFHYNKWFSDTQSQETIRKKDDFNPSKRYQDEKND